MASRNKKIVQFFDRGNARVDLCLDSRYRIYTMMANINANKIAQIKNAFYIQRKTCLVPVAIYISSSVLLLWLLILLSI